jgi:hypothetical protein
MEDFLKNTILSIAPEAKTIMDKYNRNEIDLDTTVAQLYQITSSPYFIEKYNQALEKNFIYAPEGMAPKLNPFYEAGLAEQLQFDDDIPELRSESLPENIMPAVPVITSSTNLVFVGKLLEKASKITKDKIDVKNTILFEKMMQTENSLTLCQESKLENINLLRKEFGQIDGYRPLEKAKPIEVDIDMEDLINLSFEECTKLAWKSLSSSQGRISLNPVIQDIVLRKLEEKKYKVSYTSSDISWEMTYVWYLDVTDFYNVNPDFDYIENVCESFCRKIEQDFPTKKIKLDIQPYSQIADRLVGWECRVSRDS